MNAIDKADSHIYQRVKHLCLVCIRIVIARKGWNRFDSLGDFQVKSRVKFLQ